MKPEGSHGSEITFELSNKGIVNDRSTFLFLVMDLNRRDESRRFLVRAHDGENSHLRGVFHDSANEIGHPYQKITDGHVVSCGPSHFGQTMREGLVGHVQT